MTDPPAILKRAERVLVDSKTANREPFRVFRIWTIAKLSIRISWNLLLPLLRRPRHSGRARSHPQWPDRRRVNSRVEKYTVTYLKTRWRSKPVPVDSNTSRGGHRPQARVYR